MKHCHFPEAGREESRAERQRSQGSFSRQLRAGSGTEHLVPDKFSGRVGVCWREREKIIIIIIIKKKTTSGEIKWREERRES